MAQSPQGFNITKTTKIAVVVSRYNEHITKELEKICVNKLKKCGVPPDNILIKYVPGAFELPLACQKIIKKGKPKAVIALGCLIRGQTSHFEWVASAASHGIMEVGLQTGVPIIFGVLTVNTVQEAGERLYRATEFARSALQLI